jgi:hypothetical protein
METPPFAKLVVRAAAGFAAIVGIWLIASGWVFPVRYPTAGRWNNVAVGIIVILMMGALGRTPARWNCWAGIIIGLWLMFSPWILGHPAHRMAQRNEVVSAMAIILASSVALMATMYMFGPPPILKGD